MVVLKITNLLTTSSCILIKSGILDGGDDKQMGIYLFLLLR